MESWENNPALVRRHQDRDQSPGRAVHRDDDEESYHDIPDSSVASSFPSTTDLPSSRHRLNFNPYGGLGWTQAVGAEDDTNVLSKASSIVSRQGQADRTAEAGRVRQSGDSQLETWGPLETTGAFEVSKAKRVGGTIDSQSILI